MFGTRTITHILSLKEIEYKSFKSHFCLFKLKNGKIGFYITNALYPVL